MTSHPTTPRRCRRPAFTLIELLTVVAIIALLIGILVPSLGGARDAAKKVKGRAAMKAIGDGLETFSTENQRELKGSNYPSSKAGEDPTANQSGPEIFGAQWAVRYLMGKDVKGYVPPSAAKAYRSSEAGLAEEGWYEPTGGSNPNDKLQDPNITLPRSGPYLTPDVASIKPVSELSSRTQPVVADPNSPRESNPVFVDAFDMPILYYAANSRFASNPNAAIAAPHDPNIGAPGGYAAIYNYSDNAFFTGGEGYSCGGTPGLCVKYDATNALILGDRAGPMNWGLSDWDTSGPPLDDIEEMVGDIEGAPNSFVNYILDRQALDASGRKSVVPVRRDSYLLFSPGKDGLFGTKDDIKSWD